jgi:hypothetical protein
VRRLPSLVCALLAALHALSFLGAGPLDDEFILYRYADNLIGGWRRAPRARGRCGSCIARFPGA